LCLRRGTYPAYNLEGNGNNLDKCYEKYRFWAVARQERQVSNIIEKLMKNFYCQ
jgi:hypothetical protein